MASLVRVTVTSYRLDGRRVAASTPGAVKHVARSPKWYGQGIPGLPASKRVPLAVSKRAAERMLADLVRAAEEGRAGLPDRAEGKPLAVLLAEYADAIRLGLLGKPGRPAPGPVHAQVAARYPLAVFADGLGYVGVGDFTGGTAAAVARLLRDRMTATGAGRWSAQTAAFHLAGCKRFVRWLAAKRLPVDPSGLDAVPVPDARNGREHSRREATPAELGRILDAARAGSQFYGLSGEERYHLYLLACATGYRLGELSRLTVAAFDFVGVPATVGLPGRATKNSKRARQPIPVAVARRFAEFLRGRAPTAPVWPRRSWRENGADMLRRDLAAAGIEYRVESPDGPTFLDFHALRHTYVTTLARSGVNVRELQELARHGDSRVTMEIYTHANPAALGEAVERLQLPGMRADLGGLADCSRDQLEAAVVLFSAVLGVVLGTALPPRAS